MDNTKLTDLDLYELLNIEITSTESEVSFLRIHILFNNIVI